MAAMSAVGTIVTPAIRRLAAMRCLPGTLALCLVLAASPAFALSEIKQGDAPALPETSAEPTAPAQEPADDTAQPPADQQPGQPPEIIYDVSRLPAPVGEMRDKIIAACATGDIEALRPLLGTGDDATQLTLGGPQGDPIDTLRSLSGDDGGQEILAILEEVMQAGFVHLDAGTPQDIYVWPYFYAVPLDSLTPPQRVELFRLVTAGDYEEMKNFGAYIFYRSGITPEGQWIFFVAGD